MDVTHLTFEDETWACEADFNWQARQYGRIDPNALASSIYRSKGKNQHLELCLETNEQSSQSFIAWVIRSMYPTPSILAAAEYANVADRVYSLHGFIFGFKIPFKGAYFPFRQAI